MPSERQRMKWTDAMVHLLISDATTTTTNNNSRDAGRKKAGALMQKKETWKSVSNAMEFNDLNMRYKQVNEILGKGRVAENQSLLDQMDHLNAQSEEEVRKLLKWKHLFFFFREMCTYHKSCSNGTRHHQSPSENQQQTHTYHNSSHDTTADNSNHNDGDDSEDESEQLQVRRSTKRRIEEEGEGNNRTTATSLEIGEVMEEEWVGKEEVEEEKEVLEIEKERLKWLKYCGKKGREMGRKKLKRGQSSSVIEWWCC